MSEQIYAGTAQYNLIYIFSIDDDAHRGYLKIGEHSFSSPSSYRQLPDNCDELNQNAHNRIRQYTRTALTRYELLHTELARKQIRLSDGTIENSSFHRRLWNILYLSPWHSAHMPCRHWADDKADTESRRV